MIKNISLLCCVFILMLVPAVARAEQDLAVVPHVDLGRYLGKWHEIARIDHSFQKGCLNSTAEYSLRDDGDLRVINSCDKAGQDERNVAEGRAWVTDRESNAKLRVQFVLTGLKLDFLSGRYWIIALDDDYRYAMVGEPGRDYLWILSRTPEMDRELRGRLVRQAANLGFDPGRLVYNSRLISQDQ